nr:CAP domain-containing protein [Chitinophaga varians]
MTGKFIRAILGVCVAVAVFSACSKDAGLLNPSPKDTVTTTPGKPAGDTSKPGTGTKPGTDTTKPGTGTNPGTTNPGTTNPGTNPGTTNPGTGVAGNTIDRAVLLSLVNDVRSKGCNCGGVQMPPVGPVVWNDLLEKAAYNFSVDMKTNNFFSHTSPSGSTPGNRLDAVGYKWNTYGENIAQGYSTEQAVIQAWIASPGHCKNIMNGSYKDMGVGRAGTYWTMDLGARSGN